MHVSEICQREVDCAPRDMTIKAAASRMHQRSVGSLLIVDDLGKPIGIVTDRDLVVRVLAEGRKDTTLSKVMTRNPVTVADDDSIEAAVAVMRETTCRRVPVVDGEGKLVGVVSLDDVLVHFHRQLADVRDLLERESPRVLSRGA